MIRVSSKYRCFGCNACVQSCPRKCISMHQDREGFLYPVVDESSCIDCGVCDKTCPFSNEKISEKPISVFAAKNKSEKQRLHSSSGGVFVLLAEQILKQGGVVFGARFNEKFEVEHCYVEKLEELKPLMRSKYLQSYIANTYREAEQFLKQGRLVLFIGTPCQILGLKSFLKKDYDNLLAVDFICHGVPSPKVWCRYLDEILKGGKQNIRDINFRAKQLEGYSWKKFGFVVNAKYNLKNNLNSENLSTLYSQDIYIQAFLSNLTIRPSCYACIAKGGTSKSDLTIGDFWGIEYIDQKFDDDKGISTIIVNTLRGKRILELISSSLDLLESDIDKVIALNNSYVKSVPIPKKRDRFWKVFYRTNSVTKAFSEANKVTLLDNLVGIINLCLSILGVIIKKIYSLRTLFCHKN